MVVSSVMVFLMKQVGEGLAAIAGRACVALRQIVFVVPTFLIEPNQRGLDEARLGSSRVSRISLGPGYQDFRGSALANDGEKLVSRWLLALPLGVGLPEIGESLARPRYLSRTK